MKFSKAPLFFLALTLASGLTSANELGIANIADDTETISLKGKSVNQVHRSKGKLNLEDGPSIESVTALSATSPSGGSTALTVSMRGQWYVGNVPVSAVTFGSTITGVDFSLNLFGGSTVDRNKTLVYLCRNQGTNCRQITGTGSGSTSTWNGSPTWAGSSSLSPGWEYWVGVVKEAGESGTMNQQVGFTGSVNMHWN